MPSVKTRSEKAVENAEMAAADLEIPVLEFVSPMPGFPGHRQFVLVRVHEEGVLFIFREDVGNKTVVDVHIGLAFQVRRLNIEVQSAFCRFCVLPEAMLRT